MIVDSVSHLNLYLSNDSSFNGTINADGEAGEIYVDLSGGSQWTLTDDSYITSLSCDADSINVNGHTLYVNGAAYTEGTASTGEAIAVVSISSGNGGGHDGKPNGKPSDGGTPPAKPD